ncbi:hypothetical protein Patl1_29786 [Pistacia atlantica]|uniref:Uncharacterized protein n=1 Tax=Pistacia atlantica TaxID=434234 RepID=A0ACC1AD78_9ROSI|nr:hypothetical protein Patl1_29786 [Pistacia atlantica]
MKLEDTIPLKPDLALGSLDCVTILTLQQETGFKNKSSSSKLQMVPKYLC